MNIGFDLDNVFIHTPPLIPHAVITRLYMKRVGANGPEYRIPSPREQFIRLLSHHPLLRQPVKKNMTFLHTLAQSDNRLVLISSRYSFLKRATEKLVKQYKLDKLFAELYFNYENKQPHVFKSEMINRLKLDAYIDDDLPLLKYVAGRNNKVKLYWLNDKQHKKIGPNILAITDIHSLLQDK